MLKRLLIKHWERVANDTAYFWLSAIAIGTILGSLIFGPILIAIWN